MGIPQSIINKALDSHRKRKPIGQILIEQNLINRKQLQEALERQKISHKPLGDTLISLGFITKDQYLTALSKHFNMPTRSLEAFKISKSLQKSIGEKFALKNKIIVLENTDNRIQLAIARPTKELSDDLYRFLPRSKTIQLFLSRTDEIEQLLKTYYSKDQAGSGKKSEMIDTSNVEWETIEEEEEDDSTSLDADAASGAVAVQYVNEIILQAHRVGSSDIHIEPGMEKRPTEVRMRIDGACRNVMEIPAKDIKAVISRIKIMSGMNIAERRRPQDGKAKLKFQGKKIELRIATLPTVNGESAVIRLLASGGALPLKKLNFSANNLERTQELVTRPHGVYLVVGPTGSGKTTTLHGILDHINTSDRKIWTAEDPVEITQPGLQQVQVNHKIGMDFAAVMRSFLRADPDVILIGEMRDFETANIAVEASLTGHMVFSTLHTNSAPETVTRLIDIGLDPFNFADALRGILAQRLVRTLCPDCKEKYDANEKEFLELKRLYGEQYFDELNIDKNNFQLHKPVGCAKCSHTGYRGRTGIHELLEGTDEVKHSIAMKKSVEEIRKAGLKAGMRTLQQDGVAKIIKGDTDLVQLHRVTAES
ncbi:MAG: phytochrome sensor protein [Candidatus Magnetoglobus multicellularis str. Araruama]|uniref:Phytochrome sensor protein n=1 Tax=Candidatus Magnetoglobus multicellularis str. Araruama TaxID=890399 RepID=A0A1V1PI84_9BACT|nr:MAG: phytochrome sensor protein [Candidatus Magnetoglobus multicellularis str. Araruama]